MRTTGLVLAIAIGMTLAIGGSAQARNSQGAYLYNTNHMDPSVPPHKHKYKYSSRRATKEQACCVWNPTIEAETCQTCGREMRYDPRTGRLNRHRIYYPR